MGGASSVYELMRRIAGERMRERRADQPVAKADRPALADDVEQHQAGPQLAGTLGRIDIGPTRQDLAALLAAPILVQKSQP
jgi:hypothetical protein